jgi:hypothetical protein
VVENTVVDNTVVDTQPVFDKSVADATSYAAPVDTSSSSSDYTTYSVDPSTQDTSGFTVDSNWVDSWSDPSAGY